MTQIHRDSIKYADGWVEFGDFQNYGRLGKDTEPLWDENFTDAWEMGPDPIQEFKMQQQQHQSETVASTTTAKPTAPQREVDDFDNVFKMHRSDVNQEQTMLIKSLLQKNDITAENMPAAKYLQYFEKAPPAPMRERFMNVELEMAQLTINDNIHHYNMFLPNNNNNDHDEVVSFAVTVNDLALENEFSDVSRIPLFERGSSFQELMSKVRNTKDIWDSENEDEDTTITVSNQQQGPRIEEQLSTTSGPGFLFPSFPNIWGDIGQQRSTNEWPIQGWSGQEKPTQDSLRLYGQNVSEKRAAGIVEL